MLFQEIFRQLYLRKIRYLLIGGLAVNLHGFSRTTDDLDIWIDFEDDNVKKFAKLVHSLGWRPKIPEPVENLGDARKRKSWIKEKNMKVYSIYNPSKLSEQADIMVMEYIDFKNAYKRREMFLVEDFKVSVMAIPDLIRLKKIAARERDIIDIKTLKRIQDLKNEKKREI